MFELKQDIHQYLEKHRFYAYESDREKLSDSFSKGFQKAFSSHNKRNLFLQKRWSDINSFGKARNMIVVELGGTNLKLFSIFVNGDITLKNTVSTPFYEEGKVYTPEVLFAAIEKYLRTLISNESERIGMEDMVFIFSYPVEQIVREDGFVDAICSFFGKTRKEDGIVGLQVGKAFQTYLRQHGYPNVHVSAVNDTSLYSFAPKAYEILYGKYYDVGMSLIVGTGANSAVTFDMPDRDNMLAMINMEFGDFKKVVLSRFDELFDRQADEPSRYLMEKMVSGAWLHQIFVIILKDLLAQGILKKSVFEGFSFESLDSEKIEAMVKKDIPLPQGQWEVVNFVWKELNKRGGALCGILVACVMAHMCHIMGDRKLSFGCVEVGSVIRKGTAFKGSFLRVLEAEQKRLGIQNKVVFDLIHFEHQAQYGGVVFDSFFNA